MDEKIVVAKEEHRQSLYPSTLSQLLKEQADRNSDATAIAAPGRAPLSYGQLYTQLNEIVETLNRQGIGRQDRVAIVLPNGPEMAVAFLAVAAGATSAPLNPAYRAAEFDFYLSDLKAKALIVQAGSDSPAIAVAQDRGITVLEVTPLAEAEAGLFSLKGDNASPTTHGGFAGPDEVALVLHTSGTTSRPKIVPLTHLNICTSAHNIRHTLGLTESDCCLNVMPLFHIHGLMAALLSSLAAGGSIVCTPGFEATHFFEWLAGFQPSWYTAVPAIHQAVLAQAEANQEIVAHCPLRFIRSSSSSLPLQVMADLEAVFKAPVIEAYGMTEATHQITSNPLPPGQRKPGSVGLAAGPEVAIMDKEGNLLPIGQRGEIVIRGINVTLGYENSPTANEAAFSHGWFRSGDEGVFDDTGYLSIIGRIKEMINRGGEQVAPREVDEALLNHPAVAQATAFAVPHATLGEDVAAAVVLHEHATVTERELRAFSFDRLADYKVPSRILIVDQIPKGPTGKPQRIGLAEKLASQLKQAFIAPCGPVEERLAHTWAEVLGLEQVGAYDNFFALNGDSLKATQLVARLRQVLQLELPLTMIFKEPILADQASVIEALLIGQKNRKNKTGVTHTNDISHLKPSSSSANDAVIAPTSFAQQRLWFIDQFIADARHTYNIPMALHVEGPLDVAVLEQALNEVIRRHAALRTTFVVNNDEPHQDIAPTLALDLPVTDLSDLSGPEKQTQAATLMRETISDHFDLSQGPLLRAHLLRLAPEKHILSLTIHHIIADGWSINVLQRELWTLYEAFSAGQPSPLPELSLQYADFAAWQREWLQGEVLDKQLAYWRQQLGNNPPPLELPTDYPHPPVQTYNGARYHVTVPGAIVEALNSLSKKESVTLFMTLTAAFKTLLHRYTQQTDITIGTPIANRTQTEIEPLIGFFVNTLALRTDLSGNPTFTELLKRVRDVSLEAYAHQEVPFEKLVAELQTDRDMSRPPFFQTVFVLQNTPNQVVKLTNLTTRLEGIHNGTTKFDLLLNLTEEAYGLTGFIEYNTDLYTEATIERMVGHLNMLLKGIITDPNTPLAQLPLLTWAERSQLLSEWAGCRTDYPREATIHHLFEAQVEQTPQAPALIFETAQMTYQELNWRANQLAHHLQSLGLKSGDLVGLCLERSPEMIIGVLGILKAGGAYVPLDPAYPKERLAFMLADTQTPLLVTQRSLLDQLPAFEGQIVCLDTDEARIEQRSVDNLTTAASAQDLAYVMYTSGSTGQPKGVSVTHRNVVRLVKNTNYAQLGAEEVFLQFAPVSFDAATLEIWGPLLNGGRLVIFPAQTPSLEMLGEVIERQQVTTLWLTAGLFHQMVDNQLDKLRGVRQLLAGGDVLSVPHAQKVLDELPNTRLINGYGPTENTTFTTCYPLPAGVPLSASVPIGRPIANTQVYILDAHLQPVPIGAPGELYTGGDGVARSYLNRPALTVERFIPNPFSDDLEARLYKTGDLARWLPDGTIEFLGRIDTQVKMRGFRIELSEIEILLSQHPAVESCVVIAREEQPGDKRLVAYVTRQQSSRDSKQLSEGSEQPIYNRSLITDHGLLITELQQHLKRQLPDYMIPAAFVVMDELPLNPNGKVERRELPTPTRSDVATEFVLPEGPIEEMLAEVWQEVLGLDQIGLHDNFFQLGGHSLLATKVISRLRQVYDIDLPLRTMFESPTIAQLAAIIEALLIDELDDDSLADLAEE